MTDDSLILTHQETLILLSEAAARGHVGATMHLERVLREEQKQREADPVNDAIDKILASPD